MGECTSCPQSIALCRVDPSYGLSFPRCSLPGGGLRPDGRKSSWAGAPVWLRKGQPTRHASAACCRGVIALYNGSRIAYRYFRVNGNDGGDVSGPRRDALLPLWIVTSIREEANKADAGGRRGLLRSTCFAVVVPVSVSWCEARGISRANQRSYGGSELSLRQGCSPVGPGLCSNKRCGGRGQGSPSS